MVSRLGEFEYDIALSLAGEDRALVEKVAHGLHDNGVKVFYDDFEKADLWGKNLYEHLADIYTNKARYCLMFLSQHPCLSHSQPSVDRLAFRRIGRVVLK